MILIGGTYKEINESSDSEVIYGSGIRALETILEFDKDIHIEYHTCCRTFARKVQLRYASNKNIEWHIVESEDVTFNYIHPFNLSSINPRPDYFNQSRITINVEGEDVLVFGMLEADFRLKAKHAVYDPQNSVRPVFFSDSESHAENLAYVLNFHEARVLTGTNEIEEQANFLFERENCKCVVIKNGAKGAFVYDQSVDSVCIIPVYITPKVTCVGSGDVFTAAFACQWFKGHSAAESASIASRAVALYANKGIIQGLKQDLLNFDFIELIPKHKGQIYLAGPFFSFSQRWMVLEFYKALQQENVDIFSPLHNVGVGGEETAKLDIAGLEKSNVVLAIADGLDVGTMFEVGYAIKRGIPVVVFNSCENSNELQMLSGTGCEIFNDFATAVYKSIWYAIK